MMQVDTLIHAAWVIPVEPDDTVLDDHSIAINNGRIVAIVPTEQARREYAGVQSHELAHHVVIPGLINTHTHAAMSLMRGVADDLPLMEWLNNHIWPIESRCCSTEFVIDGTLLAMAEMLKGGITCFSDMYFFPDEVAKLAERIGMRAVVGLIMLDFPTAWGQGPKDYLHNGLALYDETKHSQLVTTAFAPHAPYTVSDGPLQEIAKYASELEIPVHMHLHETSAEVEQGIAEYGIRPLERLDRLDLLNPQLVAVHMTQLTEQEITRCAEAGVNIVHCPESNLKLASGFAPISQLLDAGVNVALGTDGAASNNDLDILGEMRSAALLAKGVTGDASALPASQVLRMATLNGAKALGIDAETGSLEVGKAADLCAVDLSALRTRPIYYPLSQLVYAASREQVSDLWVAGRHLVKDGQLTTLDEEALLQRTDYWQDIITEIEGSSEPIGEDG